jgi:hypothetical protein
MRIVKKVLCITRTPVLTEVIFLGPKFSKDGVHADQAKVKAIVEIVCFYKRPVFTTDF